MVYLLPYKYIHTVYSLSSFPKAVQSPTGSDMFGHIVEVTCNTGGGVEMHEK